MRKIIKRRIEGSFCDIDEITMGIYMYYGADQYGEFHCTSIGIIFFELSILNYFEYGENQS